MFLTANIDADFSNVALPTFDSSLEYDEVNKAVSSDMDAISTENESDRNSEAMDLDADDNQTPEESFVDGLRRWALETNQTHQAIHSLLSLVRQRTPYNVPKDARTFLQTPRGTEKTINTIGGGQLWYHGIAKSLQKYFR